MVRMSDDARWDVVSFCKSQVGVPWVHQGKTPGVGMDCLGLVLAAYSHAGVVLDTYEGYGRCPPISKLKEVLHAQFDRVRQSSCCVGDVMLLNIMNVPVHFGIVSEVNGSRIKKFIHAYNAAPISRVTETIMSNTWHGRIEGIYTLK